MVDNLSVPQVYGLLAIILCMGLAAIVVAIAWRDHPGRDAMRSIVGNAPGASDSSSRRRGDGRP